MCPLCSNIIRLIVIPLESLPFSIVWSSITYYFASSNGHRALKNSIATPLGPGNLELAIVNISKVTSSRDIGCFSFSCMLVETCKKLCNNICSWASYLSWDSSCLQYKTI